MKTIAIVGGGFAGTTLLRALDGRLPAGYELLLVSDESYTTFNPMLPEAVGASVFPEQVVAPIRQMIRHARFVMGRVTAVDPSRRTLQCDTLAGVIEQPYEHLVLAFGNRARIDLLPGLAEHGIALKTLWRAHYLSQMPILGRKLRIFVEWTWGMFFPNDITHLRFTRSQELDSTTTDTAKPRALATA